MVAAAARMLVRDVLVRRGLLLVLAIVEMTICLGGNRHAVESRGMRSTARPECQDQHQGAKK